MKMTTYEDTVVVVVGVSVVVVMGIVVL